MGACMALLGGAWTTNVVWQLSGGPRRFGELMRDIPGISPKMLTARLRELEDKGVVEREVVPTSPPSVEYSLSELGHELVPVIDSIFDWTEAAEAHQRMEANANAGKIVLRVG